MRHTYSGGIYGKTQKLQIIAPTGESITITGGQATRGHTRIWSVSKELRERELRRLYEAFTADSDYLNKREELDAYFAKESE